MRSLLYAASTGARRVCLPLFGLRKAKARDVGVEKEEDDFDVYSLVDQGMERNRTESLVFL